MVDHVHFLVLQPRELPYELIRFELVHKADHVLVVDQARDQILDPLKA